MKGQCRYLKMEYYLFSSESFNDDLYEKMVNKLKLASYLYKANEEKWKVDWNYSTVI
jgi:arginyl-tRNA synthetase